MKQLLLLRLLIIAGIITASGGLYEAFIHTSDISFLIFAGLVDISMVALLYMTTKASNAEKQETIKDLFKK